MRVKISSTDWYTESEILRQYPCLKEYSFEAGPKPDYGCFQDFFVEINNLEELIKLMRECGEPLILGYEHGYSDNEFDIEIYDGYRE